MIRKTAGQRGMTLIELLVAMAIGLGITLAVSSLVVVGENHKRTTTSTNDAEQTGAFAFYALDRALRSAGSGIVESAYPSDRGVLGCRLNAQANGTIILPRTASAFPTPFGSFLGGAGSTAAGNLRVAPVLIGYNQSTTATGFSDVLVTMGGSGAAGGVSRQVTGVGGATSLVLDNTVGFNQGDIGIVSQSGPTDCLIEEVSSSSPITQNTLPLGGPGNTYYTTGSTTTISTLAGSTSSYVTPLGNKTANNVQFQLFGVNGTRTLYSYDLLQNVQWVQGSGGDTSQAIADGVDQMHAIYGIDTAGTGVMGTGNGGLGTWASPGNLQGDTGYDIATVMTTPATIKKIIAVRVALVLRGEYADKNTVSPASLTLFSGYYNRSGNSLAQTVNLQPNDQNYRYRVFEFTVPLRNAMLLASSPP